MFNRNYQRSYSQCGEDCIVNFLRKVLSIQPFSYLDIGANHPYKISNTAMFYKDGCRGVIIEPDPSLYSLLKRKRRHDTVLNFGVAPVTAEDKDFFLLSPSSLNTFSKTDAERCVKMGNKIRGTIKIPCFTIMEIVEKYFTTPPSFISIDCEGLDLQILKSIDFTTIRPEIICIETIEYEEDMTGKKDPDIPIFMREMGYFAFADTFINTIFLDKEKWQPK